LIVIKDDPEVLPMFREAMKGQAGRPKTGSNPTLLEKDRGKAYTLTRLQKDNPEEEAKKASKTARLQSFMDEHPDMSDAQIVKETGESKQLVHHARKSKENAKQKPLTNKPRISVWMADPHRTAANIHAKNQKVKMTF
jgi:hypothetical protein